ncbi:calcium/sodium antiporter [Egicoccus halophilus]|uniref:Sodium:calcium antiporter n=1 Tax=Egicoccus halophilus TaxID=1670830 RepID=A0A8J3A9B0_9ACTN|nr:calcium/sodium antiporter [Egicoccus halophilus]GGI07828.1 sodium:calcium antiporter [Egicoccus halophilus]
MLLPVLGVVAGLALLTFAADQFVAGAARIAAALRLSAVVIGAVVIGFGTSAPEMVVSGLAAAQGSLDIGVGNIVGSNVANLTLVLGVAAMLTPIAVSSPVLKREAPLSLALTVVFAVLVQGGLSRWNAAVLGLLLVVALALILRSARSGDPSLSGEVDGYLADGAVSLPREWVRTVLGLLGTLAAAQLLVASATTIAAELGLAEGFVGLTVVAIGTSLPELATAVQAARKGETDLIVGNLLGSNLFNSGAVSMVAGLAGPGPLADPTIVGFATVLMVAVAVLATAFMVTGKRVVRWEGAALLIGYLVCIPLLA